MLVSNLLNYITIYYNIKNMKQLKSFESACAVLGYNPQDVLPIVNNMPASFAKATIAATKLFVLSEAAWKLEKKVIDWGNHSQHKYYPWWNMNSSNNTVGSAPGFSYRAYDYVCSATSVGSRLVFPSSKIAIFIAKQFYDLYRDLMVI